MDWNIHFEGCFLFFVRGAALIRITVVSRSCGDDPVSNPQNLKKQQHRCLQAFVGLALYLVDWASLLGTVSGSGGSASSE